ncbi:hypothetical protein [Stenotrophomonas maltophilia]|uniref:Transmembrane protein n=1 Tax=Stenotrophomonas maltophilia TaxID=40324 RepID=A0A4S2CUD9_STEMA|nr:hypothetical protein [Stenotrophomonas maltophilia]TGY32527.1 hypothetical protein E5352_15185 [Stenotrophomonas maltophilia]
MASPERGYLKPVNDDFVTVPRSRMLAGGGGSGDDRAMEARLKALEVLVPTLATKDDVGDVRSDFQKGVNDLIKWIVGTAFVGMAMFITIMAFVLNNAVPKAVSAPAAQPQPIVIQLPAQFERPAPSPAP